MRSSRSSSNSHDLLVGRLGRAVGLRGEIELHVESDAPDRFASGSVVYTASDNRTLTVRSMRERKSGAVVAFEEVADRTGAEALRGAELVVPVSEARPLGPDEYWDHDLVGCEVIAADGSAVGVVTDVLHGPANEVLVVRGELREHLVPLIRDAVRSVDPGRRIVIEPFPGLLQD